MRRLIVEEPYAETAIWSRRLSVFALAVACIGIVLARTGLDAMPVYAILGSSFVIACIAILCAGAAAVVIWETGRRGAGVMLMGVTCALLLLGYPAYLAVAAIRLPVLSDVSTDLDDPPAFSRSRKALAARGNETPGEMSSASRAEQKEAYPNVQPVMLDLDADAAYKSVLKVIAAKHWQIIDQVPPGGRAGLAHIDVVVKSLVLGLPDDLTIRIAPQAGQTRVDLRCASRVGRHDFGENAKRIAQFSEALEAETESD